MANNTPNAKLLGIGPIIYAFTQAPYHRLKNVGGED